MTEKKKERNPAPEEICSFVAFGKLTSDTINLIYPELKSGGVTCSSLQQPASLCRRKTTGSERDAAATTASNRFDRQSPTATTTTERSRTNRYLKISDGLTDNHQQQLLGFFFFFDRSNKTSRLTNI